MKFYPADWRADAMLRLCSIGARGLWAEMMCLMHEAEKYGSLLVNGKRIDKKQLAGLAGITEKECVSLLLELEGNGVFSRDEDGTIYSRRMRRDHDKAVKDKENGRGGGNPKLKAKDNGGVNPLDKGVDKAQKPEARSQKLDSEPNGSGADGAVTEAEVYRFGRALLGKSSGGVITEIRKHCRHDLDAALNLLQQAEDKGDPMAWLQGVLRGDENAKPTAKQLFPEEIYRNVL